MLVLLLAAGSATTWAQRMIRVSGTVLNVADKRHKVPFTDIAVQIYSCKTVAEAEDLRKTLENNRYEGANAPAFYIGSEKTETDANGYYEILVPDNGALVFKAGMNEPIVEKVNNRMKINIEVKDGIMLGTVTVTGKLKQIQPEPKASRLIGNQFYPYNSFVVPQGEGNTYSRLIIQPYVMNCVTNDTVGFLTPLVYDGKEFHLTQDRKMGYDLKRDPLEPFINSQPLTRERMLIEWKDTITVPDPNANYSCYADFCIEDYNSIPFRKIFQLNTCENKRPLKFLEYAMEARDLNFNDYPEKAQVEKRNTEDLVELNFEINSDKLTDDPKNQENLQKIADKLNLIMNEPGAMLKEFHVMGTASPEGRYQSNLKLAERRMKRIQTKVMEVIPPYTAERVYQNPQAVVASWNEVAELLEKDGKTALAERIRDIVAQYPDRMDRQGAVIRGLAEYREGIVPYLEQLRQVKYMCRYDIYREPTDEEVMQQFEKEGMDGIYTRYEYWKLLQMITDDSVKEAVAKKAYEESLEMKQPWVLAGNMLAAMYLRRDTTDTRVLEPLIDRTVFTVNYVRTNADSGHKETVNPVEVVANQLCMYIKAGDFENASVMAKLIPDSEKDYDLLKAYAWALGGYFHGGETPEVRERSERTFNTICQSSPRNRAVMNLALETPEGDKAAEEVLKLMETEDAVVWYLRAIVAARKGEAEINEAAICLVKSFNLDKKLIATAQNDGEFDKEIVEMALDMYNNQ